MVVIQPGTTTPHTEFEAVVYVLSKDKSGRHTPAYLRTETLMPRRRRTKDHDALSLLVLAGGLSRGHDFDRQVAAAPWREDLALAAASAVERALGS